MITTRARGLATLHTGITALCVGAFFWIYAELILRYVPVVRLTLQMNLLPYFLCVIGAIALSSRDVSRLVARMHRLDFFEAARLAAKQAGFMAVFIFAMMFTTQDRGVSRLFFGTLLVWNWIGLTMLNARLPRVLARIVFPRGEHLPTVFVGPKLALENLDDWISHKELLGMHRLGVLSDDPPEARDGGHDTPWLGRLADLSRVLVEHQVGQVILLELPASDVEARNIIEICQEHGCRLLIHNNLAERYTQPLVPTIEDGRHFYTLQEEPLEDPINRLIKRTFDVLVSLPIVLFVLPILCVWVWVAQRIQSPGPLFHARERRGQRGGGFRMLKFRSMQVAPENPAAESQQASAEDQRIFPFGRFLRRRSLDEFPQFWNVLCGDMSVVGPRPYMPLLDEEFRRQTRGYRTRHLVKPGITGLAQSLGFRGEILTPEMLKRRVYWDVFYITHWSVWLDLQITMRTLWQVVFPPRSAY
jgi:exopolysaccharide biosynthesis polyprenyl glycosylphosphotransferase